MAHLKLEQLHDSFTAFCELAPIGYFVLNRKRSIVQVNRTGASMVGVKKDALIGKSLGPYINKKYKSEFNKTCLEVLQTSSRKKLGLRISNKKNKEFFAQFIIDPIENSKGEFSHCLVCVIDMSSQKQAEERADSLAGFPSENPFPILRISENGTILYCNKPGKILLHKWKCKIGKKVPNDWRALILQTLKSKKYIVKEVQCGQTIFSLSIVPVPDGQYVNLYGSDFTKIRNAQEQMKQSEEKYHSLFNTMTEGFALHEIICDKKGKPCDYRFIELNHAFEILTGLKEKDVKGKTVKEVIPVIDQFGIEEYGKVAMTGKSKNIEQFSKHLGKYFEVFAYRPAPMQFAVVFKDITKRRLAEEEIKNLARFPQENPFPVLRIKTDCTILYSNTPGRVLLKEWKRKVGQKVPNNWVSFILKSVRYKRQLVEQIKCGQSIFSIAITPLPGEGYVNLYGRDITIQEQIKEEFRRARDELDVKVHQRTTELAQTVAILQKEIKERILAQTQLKERTKVLDAFFAYAITPLVILDKNFNFIRVNKAYADSCQRDIDEFSGHNHFDFYPHEENENIFKQVVNTKEPYQAIAKPFSFPDHPELGVSYWDWTLVPILDKDKNVEFLVFSLLDVTKRRQAELALIESEQKYRSLVEFSPESVCVLSDEKFVFANASALKLLKVNKPDDIVGISIFDFVHPDFVKTVRDDFKSLLEKNSRIPQREIKLIFPDTSFVEIETSATSVEHQGKHVILIMFHDITERKRAEDEIRKNQKELRTMSAKLQLAEEQERRRIAQDLHDSIGQILAFSGRELKHLQKSVSEDAGKTIKEIAHQLDLAITQTRTLSFDLSPSILYDLGFEVAVEDLVDRISRDRKIQCRFKSCSKQKPLTNEVEVLLYRSIRELLINAVKYSQANLIKVSLLRSGSDIHINVEDDGKGFDVSILNGISTKRKGFGIFSIRERLNHIGGKLKIESTIGRGTKAELIAPLDMGHEKQ